MYSSLVAVEVGIRELRAGLSRWLQRAAAGEEIVVTDRGRPLARVTGLDGRSTLERLIAEGRVTPAPRPKTPVQRDCLPRVARGKSLAEYVVEQR